MIRHFRGNDADAVDRLYARCHPGWPAKPAGWWWAHPTLVLETEEGLLIGATAFAVSPAPAADLMTLLDNDRAEVGWGKGLYVAPDHGGQGHGWRLAQARHQALRGLGVHFFLGLTQPDNVPMRAIFMRQKLKQGVTVPRIYPDGQAGVMYHGEIV